MSLKLAQDYEAQFQVQHGDVIKRASLTIKMLSEVQSVSLSEERVVYGNKIQATVTLNRPAIGDGNRIEINITENRELVRWSPDIVVVPPGKRSTTVELSTRRPRESSAKAILNFRCAKKVVTKILVIMQVRIGLLGLVDNPDIGGGEGYKQLDASRAHEFKIYAVLNFPSPFGGITYKLEKECDFIDKINVPETVVIPHGLSAQAVEVSVEPVNARGDAYLVAVDERGFRYKCHLVFQ